MFRKAVHDREKVETTGVGHGVAIAHGKLDTIHKIRIGLGISQEGVEFESKDGKPVHILFVISSSANLQIQYIKALASILRNVRNAEIREEVTRIFEPGFVPNRCNLLLKELELQSY
jgi:PTS system nitrogen regulatory IIA component